MTVVILHFYVFLAIFFRPNGKENFSIGLCYMKELMLCIVLHPIAIVTTIKQTNI